MKIEGICPKFPSNRIGTTLSGASFYHGSPPPPTAEWSPGTYRVGALLEKSLLLLVQHNPMENPPESQADPLESLSLCQSCPGLSIPRALLCLAKGYGKITRVSAVAPLCCRGILP